MVIRIALQCNEADAYLIMDDRQSRAAPALASGRRHLQRRCRRDGRQQSVPGRLAVRRGARRAIWTKSAHRPIATARNVIRRRSSSKAMRRPTSARMLRLRALLEAAARCTPELGPRSGSARRIPSKARPKRCSSGKAATILLIVGQRDEATLTHRLDWRSSRWPRNIPTGAARFMLLDSTPAGLAASGTFWNGSSQPFRTK